MYINITIGLFVFGTKQLSEIVHVYINHKYGQFYSGKDKHEIRFPR